MESLYKQSTIAVCIWIYAPGGVHLAEFTSEFTSLDPLPSRVVPSHA
jgi:hypothetical protein